MKKGGSKHLIVNECNVRFFYKDDILRKLNGERTNKNKDEIDSLKEELEIIDSVFDTFKNNFRDGCVNYA